MHTLSENICRLFEFSEAQKGNRNLSHSSVNLPSSFPFQTHQNKNVSSNGATESPSTPQTSEESKTTAATVQNKILDANLFDPIVSNELTDSVWRLADQNDIDKDNQIFYVTYQDPNLGNKTMKLVNQVVSNLSIWFFVPQISFFYRKNSTNQLDTTVGVSFTDDTNNEHVNDLPFGDEDDIIDDGGTTSNVQLLADASENVILDRKVSGNHP